MHYGPIDAHARSATDYIAGQAEFLKERIMDCSKRAVARSLLGAVRLDPTRLDISLARDEDHSFKLDAQLVNKLFSHFLYSLERVNVDVDDDRFGGQ